MLDTLWLIMISLALVALVGALLLAAISAISQRRKSKKSAAPSATDDKATAGDAHTYDPKDGLLIVTGTENPAVRLPGSLTAAERKVVDDYLTLGKDLGLAISYFPHGASVQETFIDAFIAAEQRYADLGFRTISLYAFEGLGGWNKPLPENEQAAVRRTKDEQPKLIGPDTKARLKELNRLY